MATNSKLPTLPGGYNYPAPTVPPKAGAPYLESSQLPENFVFIVVVNICPLVIIEMRRNIYLLVILGTLQILTADRVGSKKNKINTLDNDITYSLWVWKNSWLRNALDMLQRMNGFDHERSIIEGRLNMPGYHD
ncbi:hypothetical protein H2202_000620 [Exophiala xenobiotica]|nr:hypothetical protein H2202_000620 [Exophiala xenobiotica]